MTYKTLKTTLWVALNRFVTTRWAREVGQPHNKPEVPERDKEEEFAELAEILAEANEEALLATGFESCLIGIARRCGQPALAVYDYQQAVELLIERDGSTYEEAIEHMEYNVVGAWMGEHTPIWLCRPEEEVPRPRPRIVYEVRLKGHDCLGHFTDSLIETFDDVKEAIRYARRFAKKDHERTKGERGYGVVYTQGVMKES